jgi:hypothetical protein
MPHRDVTTIKELSPTLFRATGNHILCGSNDNISPTSSTPVIKGRPVKQRIDPASLPFFHLTK